MQQLCVSISSLLGSRGLGSDGTERISSSMCSSSALHACAPWGCASIKISAPARCGTVARCPARSLALPLEHPTCTGANTFPGLIQHSNSQWFRTLSTTTLSSFFVPQDTTTCRQRGASIIPFGTKLAHTHDGSIDFTHKKRDPDLASIVKFHRYLIAHRSVSVCVHLPIPDGDSWLGAMAIHSKSRGEDTTHAHLRNSPPIRAEHTNLCTGGMVLCVGSLPRCIQFRNSHLHPHPGDGTVASVVLSDS